MVMSHYFEGGWYPVGGSQTIVDAYLRALAAAGAEIRVRAPVARLLLDEGMPTPTVAGVALADGTEIRARLVVSNADPIVTYGMVPGTALSPRLRRRMEEVRWSATCLSLYGAARLDPEALHLDSGNVWSFDHADVEPLFRSSLGVHRFPGTFLTVTSLKDRTRLHDGVHTFEAFAFVPWGPFSPWHGFYPGSRPDAYDSLKGQLNEAMLASLESVLPGIRDSLVVSSLGTPLSNASWVAATHGNIYGTEKVLDQMGPRGFHAQSEVRGLYLCGASVGSMGVLGASWSGLRTAALATGASIDGLLSHPGPPITTLPAESPDAWAALAKRVAA
jgi:phytoene dehydrogenase-like protein